MDEPLSESAENPNLEYDPEFVALEKAAQPKPERVMGDQVLPGEEPVWPDVISSAEALLQRTKDLRVAMLWTVAALKTQGFPGFAEGLGRIQSMLEQDWDVVHPQLDADDNNDPTLRINSLATLTDATGFLRYLRETAFLTDPQLGPITLRLMSVARGEIPVAEGTEAPTETQIEAACRDADAGSFDAAATAVAEISTRLAAIEGVFSERLGIGGPDLATIRGYADGLNRFLEARKVERAPPLETPQEEASAESGGDIAAVQTPARAAARGVGGPISSPDDVRQALEAICRYYEQMEPSSPVPILLRRAERLVGKSFVDLLADLTPGGMDQIRVFQGESSGS